MTEHETLEEALHRRRDAVSALWSLTDEVVLIGAGDPIHVPDRGDVTYPFRAHSEYLYLTDRNRPSGVLAFDPSAGWFDFVAPVTLEEVLWSGAQAGQDDGLALSQFADWLVTREPRPIAALGSPRAGVGVDDALTERLRYQLDHVRRPKDPIELDRMRRAEQATRAGFEAIQPMITAGVPEREVQIGLKASFLRSGADAVASTRSSAAARTRRCCTSQRPSGLWSAAISC